jgi:broad specificity phosphatase PhoE
MSTLLIERLLCVMPFLGLLCMVQCAPPAHAKLRSTVVYVVRHAEKLDPADRDSPLSPAGMERAEALAGTLAQSGVQAIYATTLQRTQQTVAPLAEREGLVPVLLDPAATEELVRLIRNGNEGQVVLVAGHNNTVPTIVLALSGTAIDAIPEDRYDRLFKVSLAGDVATVEELRYGKPTP